MILPGETEAGTAGTQPCRGILRWAHRDDGQGREDRPCAAQPPSDRKTPCLKNPRPEGAESTLTENAVSPFHAEPTQVRIPPGPFSHLWRRSIPGRERRDNLPK